MRSVLLLLALAATGCQVLAGYEDFKGSTGEGGAGGSGGTAQGGSGGTAQGGSGGEAGAGAPGACAGKTPPSIAGGPSLVATEIGDYDTVSKTLNNPSCAWVDSTEVTFEQYELFLTQSGVTAEKPLGGVSQAEEACKTGNTDLRPDPVCIDGTGGDPKPRTGGKLPVVCVDACDAAAFCRWAGKELCSGGAQQSPSRNPMFMACSQGNKTLYPYGNLTQNQYEANRCNDNQNNEANCAEGSCAVEVGSDAGCVTPGGVFDLVGNVTEWTADCGSDVCNARGGSYLFEAANATCDGVKPYARTEHRPDLGFRCCKLGN